MREGNLIIIEDFGISNPKTSEFLVVMDTLGLVENKKRAKTLIIDSLDNANLVLSSRNVKKTKVTNSFGLNIYDIIYHEKLLISKTAVAELNTLLDPKRERMSAGELVETAAEAAPAPKAKAKKEAAVEAVEAVEDKPKAKKEAKPKAEKAPKAEAAPVEEAPAVETSEEATENE